MKWSSLTLVLQLKSKTTKICSPDVVPPDMWPLKYWMTSLITAKLMCLVRESFCTSCKKVSHLDSLDVPHSMEMITMKLLIRTWKLTWTSTSTKLASNLQMRPWIFLKACWRRCLSQDCRPQKPSTTQLLYWLIARRPMEMMNRSLNTLAFSRIWRNSMKSRSILE